MGELFTHTKIDFVFYSPSQIYSAGAASAFGADGEQPSSSIKIALSRIISALIGFLPARKYQTAVHRPESTNSEHSDIK